MALLACLSTDVFWTGSDLKRLQPTRVINAAGVRGTPNVDWCEDHKEETIRANIIGATNLVDCCFLLGIHVTHFSSGCIYDYNDAHPPGGKAYTEEEEPNFYRSFYSNTKIIGEKVRYQLLQHWRKKAC